MTKNTYDRHTAAGYKATREIPREGLSEWREAVRRHLRPSPGMTLLDIGAGTGQFATAFSDWFGISVIAVEPSAAMRARIPRTAFIEVRAGDANALPLPDASVDAAWLSLVIHHVPALEGAAREIRRVLRPGAPVLVRQGFSDRIDYGIELVRWFPETSRVTATFPSLQEVCDAFAAAGLHREALDRVGETYPGSLAELLGQVDTLRRVDTTLRALADDEFLRGKERLRRAVDEIPERPPSEPRSNLLDLLVLR